MEDDREATEAPNHHAYKSRPGALVWFFRKSRDGWKRKHHDLKAAVKGYKVRVADLSKSRDRWRLKAEEAAGRLAASEAEAASLRARLATLEREKKRPTTAAP